MDLAWLERDLVDSDGDPYHVHYLVDQASQRCLATIPEPRKGNILYQADMRMPGEDRFYVTLDAAKSYCESTAELNNIAESDVLKEKIRLLDRQKEEVSTP